MKSSSVHWVLLFRWEITMSWQCSSQIDKDKTFSRCQVLMEWNSLTPYFNRCEIQITGTQLIIEWWLCQWELNCKKFLAFAGIAVKRSKYMVNYLFLKGLNWLITPLNVCALLPLHIAMQEPKKSWLEMEVWWQN